MDPDTLAACKTLMDRKRLRILGALGATDATTAQLAETLALPHRVVARHLDQLRHVGLVSVHIDGNGADAVHVLAVGRLASFAAELARIEAAQRPSSSDLPGPDAALPGQGWSQEDVKTLQAFITDGRITTIPAQHAKRQVILRFLAATVFTPGVRYPEKDVDMRLALRHPDVASLRRYLVDDGYMERSSGVYQLRQSGAREAPSDVGA